MTKASMPAFAIPARSCSSRASKVATGNSSALHPISPRRMTLPFGASSFPKTGSHFSGSCSSRHAEQFARSAGQHLAAILGHCYAVAQHHVADGRMIGVGMHDQRHPGVDTRGDVFEDVRLGIGEQPHAMATHARELAGGVLAHAVFTEHV